MQWQRNPAHFKAWQEGKRDTRLLMLPCVSLTALAGCIPATDDYSQFFGERFIDRLAQGERYFMSQLIDGDLAANNGAGSGPLQPEPMQRRIFVFLTDNPGREI